MQSIGQYNFKNRQNKFYQINSESVFVDRLDYYDNSTSIIETYASNWFLGFIGQDHDRVQIRTGNSFINLTGPSCIILPPFSLIEWQIQPGAINWQGIFIKNLEFTFSHPILSTWNQEIPLDTKSTIDLILNTEMGLPINIARDNCALSEKVKHQIDQNFKEELKIQFIAEQLKVHRSFMCRCFKNTFGLSPIEYRHKLRVFEALKIMNQNHKDITYAALESGFSSIQRFEEHFHKTFGISPNKFHF